MINLRNRLFSLLLIIFVLGVPSALGLSKAALSASTKKYVKYFCMISGVSDLHKDLEFLQSGDVESAPETENGEENNSGGLPEAEGDDEDNEDEAILNEEPVDTKDDYNFLDDDSNKDDTANVGERAAGNIAYLVSKIEGRTLFSNIAVELYSGDRPLVEAVSPVLINEHTLGVPEDSSLAMGSESEDNLGSTIEIKIMSKNEVISDTEIKLPETQIDNVLVIEVETPTGLSDPASMDGKANEDEAEKARDADASDGESSIAEQEWLNNIISPIILITHLGEYTYFENGTALLAMSKTGIYEQYSIDTIQAVLDEVQIRLAQKPKEPKEDIEKDITKERRGLGNNMDSRNKTDIDVTVRTCPICGREYSGPPALSRTDNKTEICTICSVKQALDVAGINTVLKDQILDAILDRITDSITPEILDFYLCIIIAPSHPLIKEI